MASLAGKLYSDAVEEAQEPQHTADGATVGQFLRQKWQQVGPWHAVILHQGRQLPAYPVLLCFRSLHYDKHQTACMQRGKSEVASHCELPAPVQLRAEQGADPIWAEAWRWRENLQRAIDGCHTTDEMSSAGLAAYSELEGPNMPLSCGYTVSH